MPRERILVVDDEPDVLRVCERILSADGYTVKTVANGFEAVQMASADNFDLLLTDIKMPGMDGLDVAEAARTVNPHLVCVTMTGYSTMDTAIDALKLGIEEFIIKPFTPQDLTAAVSRALEKERLRRESGRLRALLPLFEANRVFMSTTDIDQLAQEVVNTTARELKADRVLLLLLPQARSGGVPTGSPRVAASYGVEDPSAPHWLAIASLALQADRPLQLDQREPHLLLSQARAAGLVACTVRSKQGNSGVLIALHDDPAHRFDEGDREFLNVLCSQAGIAMENANLFGELRRAYEELKQLDYMKSEFISIAAHELRTPLAILMGYAGILEGMVPGDIKQYATIILRNATRLRALMDEMLNLDSLERGASLVRLEAISLSQAVSEIVNDLRPLADNRHQTLTQELPAGDLRLTTDREKFGMVLANLVSNAIKFTRDGGTITVRAASHADGVIVEVQDTGIGIPEDQWDKIFDRFYQVEDSLTREHEGMGLGLSIAKGMVELLGGRIWVDSKLGEGSTFHFTVPLAPKG